MQRGLDRLQRILELHIRADKIVRSLEASMQALDPPLDYASFRTLGAVLTLGPTTLKQVTQQLELPKTTIHYIIRKLIAAGYVERSTIEAGSTPSFSCTAAGEALWERAAEAFLAGSLGRALTRLTDEELAGALNRARRLWGVAGAERQNAAIFMESALLAAHLMGSVQESAIDRTEAPSEPLRSSF